MTPPEGTPQHKRIAVCFFGITRSLETTIGSIRSNVLEPARRLGTVRLFTHLYALDRIDNLRSGEHAQHRVEEHELLGSDWTALEEPGACLEARGIDDLKVYGDTWGDGFQSLRNLVHQLHSLDVVTAEALEWQPDVVVFCRPDLRYLDSLEPWLKASLVATAPTVWVPSWQHWGGFNDRFAICAGPKAAASYGRRVDAAVPFVRVKRRALNGEHLLAWRLRRDRIRVRLMNARAVRVRVGGGEVKERFSPGWTDVYRQRYWKMIIAGRKLLGKAEPEGDGAIRGG